MVEREVRTVVVGLEGLAGVGVLGLVGLTIRIAVEGDVAVRPEIEEAVIGGNDGGARGEESDVIHQKGMTSSICWLTVKGSASSRAIAQSVAAR